MHPADIRARIGHPVVDADGHTLEYRPALDSYLAAEGAADVNRLMETHLFAWSAASEAERSRHRIIRPPWFGLPAEATRDLATATMPDLMHRRLPDLGIDVAVVYGSFGVGFAHVPHDDLRRASCRAVNRFNADLFDGLGDRLVPVAVIPMNTPEEAVAELRHAVVDLGYKAVVLAGWVRRPLDPVAEAAPSVAHLAAWYDFFGLDSAHDYDVVWETCRQLGVMPSFHSGSMGWTGAASTSNYTFNHIGHFANGNFALAKALFLGGVTRRFPELRFAFLEGGTAWAVSLLADLVGHWDKRNADAVRRYDPTRIDRRVYDELFATFGTKLGPAAVADLPHALGMTTDFDPATIDEFDGIASRDEIYERFVPQFFFGCEADDPMTSVAFDRRRVPFGQPLQAMFSSDIGHWDVPDMDEVLTEAYEAVEKGWMDDADFEAFCFTNPVRFYAGGNPGFFDGTPVADAARALLGPTA